MCTNINGNINSESDQCCKRAIKISYIKKPGVSIGRLLCSRSLAFEFDEFDSIIIK